MISKGDSRKIAQRLEVEPIAIIGLSCRFPKAENLEAFWRLLRNGLDGITEVPPERWDVSKFYDPAPATAGKANTCWGGFLEKIDQFDAGFFGITPREAERMDPQQRLLLEVTWEALENGGILPSQLSGTPTGVFIGISNSDYARLMARDIASINAYNGTGTSFAIAANRISYFFNLKGPSLAIDTACSSSLIAVHYACHSLQSGESNLCFVGGVNAILSPEATVYFSQARLMAADGRCKTFDDTADGYVRGEGCGVIILKRLSDAIKDGDNIHAIIRGTAVNQDGLTNGITAPNGPSQQAVIRQALNKANILPSQISYVEAHGTGTPLGDPQEFKSLKAVLLEGRQLDELCYIGSVKTNIGHLESAAGIAGLIKVVLSLKHQEIPPHLHLKHLNRYISLEETPLRIPTECQPWTTVQESRLAGVSSFGFGGTNCHIILEESPIRVKSQKPQVKNQGGAERPLNLLTLSAKNETALRELAKAYQTYFQFHPEASLADVCFTANTGRTHFEHRLALIAESTLQIGEQLEAFLGKEQVSSFLEGQVTRKKPPRIAFLFTGQGSQYVHMGKQLYETQPFFRQTLDQCEDILRPHLRKPILDVIYPESTKELNSSVIDQTAYTQPALFAIEFALAQLWQSWGIKPDVVMGHSVGEYVAATVAGVFSLEDGLKLIANRGRLMQQLPDGGEMLAVMASEKQVSLLIAPYKGKVSIAAINGPFSIVISGAAEAIRAVKEVLELEGVKAKPLQVSHAFHSPLMEPMLADFEAVAHQVTYSQPRIPLISNVTGCRESENIATAKYWVNHVHQPVMFAQSMETLHQEGYEVFLEIGPKPILLGMGRQCLPENVGVWIPSLRCVQSDWQQMLYSLAELYVRGVKVDWSEFDRDYSRSKVELPTYPFQRQRYWIDAESSFQAVQTPAPSRKASPKVPITLQGRPSTLNSTYVSPRTQIEKNIAQILEEALGIQPIGIEDDFFELGGDSLLAIQIISRLSQEFKVKLNQSQLMETPTIAKLVCLLDKNDGNYSSENPSLSSLVKIQASGSQLPLFLVHPASGNAFGYLDFSKYLELDRYIYGIEDPGLHGDLESRSFPEKARFYIDLIRSVQPQGPYHVAGYSYGGNMAFEMAVQLTKEGQEVAFLGMLDSFPPSAYENIFIDDTRLLAALWHMTGLIFDKQPRDWLGELQQVEADRQIEYVVQQLLEDSSGIPLPKAFVQQSTLMVAMNNFRQLHDYKPQEVYAGQITYFVAEEKIPTSLSDLLNYQIPDDLIKDGWGKLAIQPIETYLVPGHHFTMFNPSNLPPLAQQFQRAAEGMLGGTL
jgi:malonyl CoA-acyl carrier protein transacylase